MQLQGKAIRHTKFGEGTVKESGEKFITITFKQGERKFLFPDAFLKFLALKDKKAQAQIDKVLDSIIFEEEKRREAELSEERLTQRIRDLKVNTNSQAAFGLLQNKKQDVFSSWTVFAGAYLSGSSIGNPKLPVKLKLNSACLLTECQKGESERNRRIIGAFMVKDDFDGKYCKDGIIKSHDSFRIKLEENEMLLFWDYFPDDAKTAKWGKAEMKYFSNANMQCILNDMKKSMVNDKRQQLVSDFYQYFCYVNRLGDL